MPSSDSSLSMLSGRQKGRSVRVELFDGNIVDIHIDRKATGRTLLELVCEQLCLMEKDYFGFLHERRGDDKVWLDMERSLMHSFKNELWEVRLAVKFYPPEPSELQEDHTRYQLKLAVRRDLLEGRLTCSNVTHALLASYLLQSELGDYEESQVSAGHLATYELMPASVLTPDLEEKILELYERHKGQTPAVAELNYLENAKKLAMYGVDLHPAKDSQGFDIQVGVCAAGISVYRDGVLMDRFAWAKVLRLSYRSRVFTLRLRASECDDFEIELIFKFHKAAAAKKLWRATVENHIFFRRAAPVAVPRLAGFPRLGSLRMSCRTTLHQLRCEPPQRQCEPQLHRSLLVR